MFRKLLAATGLFLVFNCAQAYTPESRPLASIDSRAFLQMSQEAQKLYVAGVMDGFTYVTYGHGFANRDAVVKCLKTRGVDELTASVVDWLKDHPAFGEGMSSAVVQTVNGFCG